jgi:hypothetical protein
VQVVVDGVEVIGPVQRDDAQPAVGLDIDFVWHVVHFIPFGSSRERSSHA